MDMIKQRAAISGIGQSEVGRRLNKSGLELTVDAVMDALADAGLEPNDIDGISTWPGLKTPVRSEPLGALELRPSVQWDSGMFREWIPGEVQAREYCSIHGLWKG